MPASSADVAMNMTLFKSLLARMLRTLPTCAAHQRFPDDEAAENSLWSAPIRLKGSAENDRRDQNHAVRGRGGAECIPERRPVDVIEEILRQLALSLATLREES